MRRLVLLLFALATLFPTLAQAYDILVLQSSRNPSCDETLKGFNAAVAVSSQRVIIMSDYAEVDVTRIVHEEHPRLILALGDAALKEARKVLRVPVVGVMSFNLHNLISKQPNLAGVGMHLPPEVYLHAFSAMKARRVGIVCNPERSGWYLEKARKAASQHGIKLVVREVSSGKDVLTALNSLTGKVDGLWMLPDSSAVTSENIDSWVNFAMGQSIPLVSFSGSYLKIGAAVAADFDRADMGRQAGEIARGFLSGNGSYTVSPPRRHTLKANGSVLKKLGIDPAVLDKL
jgi:putative tryptophan/tyrosine transport system substrate-binding protein